MASAMPAARPGPPPLMAPRTLWTVAGALGALFLLLALWVLVSGKPTRLDTAVAGLFAHTGGAMALRVFAADVLSAPGHTEVVVLLLAVVVTAAAMGRHLRLAVALVTGGTIGFGAIYILKAAIARARPSNDLTVTFAFPSGHATKAALAIGLVLYGVWCLAHARAAVDGRPGPGRRGAVAAWATWAVLTLLTGIARLLADVHWATDILGGWALGTMMLALTIAVHRHAALLPVITDGPGLQPVRTGSSASRSATPAERA